jgi:hypothetical protein
MSLPCLKEDCKPPSLWKYVEAHHGSLLPFQRWGIVEEGRTPEAAVKRCLETLFELMRSYTNTPPQELSQQAHAHWRQLQAVAQLTRNGRHRKA